MPFQKTLLSTLAVIAITMPAMADIGAIGSPVVPSNIAKQEQDNAGDAENAGMAEAKRFGLGQQAQDDKQNDRASEGVERKPVLIIRFNQNHVYYERALQMAIDSTEQTKGGAFYELVSYVPNSTVRSQNARNADTASDNMQAVVQSMQSMGIPASRIGISVDSSTPVASQEIHIFVK